jgi:hypothetical protein
VPGAVAVSDAAQLPHFPRGENVHDPRAYDLGRPYHALKQIADSLDIRTIDLTSDLRAAGAEPAYFPASWHWTPSGHRAAAGAIARALDSLGFLGVPCS